MNEGSFIGYEYRDITVSREQEGMYADGYQNFGWLLEGVAAAITPGRSIMKFKRDRKIRNKAELTRLQRQFDACVDEISAMEKSKESVSFAKAMTVGLVGTAFLAGATFSYLGGMIVLCIILAIPGFAGWIAPYFLHRSTYAKKAAEIAPVVEAKYDEAYEICERANSLLAGE